MTDNPFTAGEPDNSPGTPPKPSADGYGHQPEPAQEDPSSTATPRWRWADRLNLTSRSGNASPPEEESEATSVPYPGKPAPTPAGGSGEWSVPHARPESQLMPGQGGMLSTDRGTLSPPAAHGAPVPAPTRVSEDSGRIDELPVPAAPAEEPGIEGGTPGPATPPQVTPAMGSHVQNVAPYATAFQAESQHFYGGDFVRQQPVHQVDLAACTNDRFIPPRDADCWEQAQFLIKEHGVVILCAPPGTGRRSTALRLLTTVGSLPLTLVDLEPEWSKPDATKLPAATGHGYVLDLSGMPQQPGPRFGQGLINYGIDGVKKSCYLVVLTTPDEWTNEWSEETRHITVKHSSPNAKPLVRQELRQMGAEDRVSWLDQDAYNDIWRSNPPAQEARRLARIVYEAKENDNTVVEEFQGWNTHINKLLTPTRQGPGEPELVSTRATVWAGALINGGRKRSVLHAADALLEKLEFGRKPLDILADATSSHRLKAAALRPHGDRAFHELDKHDLAPAILRHLWDEFPTQRDLLRSWAVSVVAQQAVPEDDARIALSALLELSKEVHDTSIIDSVAKEVTGRRLPLAVEALTSAALDPTLGKYVRGRLYRWMLGKPSPAMVDLVTQICGGELAVRQPSIAMTRLARAAVHAPFPSSAMVDAFRRLIQINAAEVAKALETWLTEEPAKRHALVAFLSLAATDEGTRLLLSMTDDAAGRQRFVRAWQQLLQDDESQSAADEQLGRWGVAAESGLLPSALLVDLMADVYEPKIYRSGLQRFFAQDRDFQDSFWGEVLERVIIRTHEREKASS